MVNSKYNIESSIFGFDLRVILEKKGTSNSFSIDPMVWESCQQKNPKLFCEIYDVNKVGHATNGVNLAECLPSKKAPSGYMWAAFGLDNSKIDYMADVFGVSKIHNLVESKFKAAFHCIGYDLVDLWTQSSFIHDFEKSPDSYSNLNKFNLFPSYLEAVKVSEYAKEVAPEYAPFDVVSIWIDESTLKLCHKYR